VSVTLQKEAKDETLKVEIQNLFALDDR